MVLGDASRRLAGVSPTVHKHESDMIVCPHRQHMRPPMLTTLDCFSAAHVLKSPTQNHCGRS